VQQKGKEDLSTNPRAHIQQKVANQHKSVLGHYHAFLEVVQKSIEMHY
jgi:hypothetical protein